MTHADASAHSLSGSIRSHPDASVERASQRKQLIRLLGVGFALACAAYLAYDYLTAPSFITTDDAYVNGSVAQVTPQIDGRISHVFVHETQYVRRGDVLVRLDSVDAALDVQAASAAYEQALRHINQNLANVKAMEAIVQAKEALAAQAKLQMQRRAGIVQSGAVSTEEVSNSRSALDAALYDLSVSKEQLAAQQTMVKDADLQNNPELLTAATALQRAKLKLSRTEIRAPVDGVIAQFHAQVGQQIPTGTSLMSIVPVDHLFVDANFKEGQLDQIRPRQSVDLTSDLYGSGVVFHGRVEGLGGGTGAAFSIIPAQNASGNWIKVVQRLPVRIALDPAELRRNPLRIGISMNVSVNVSQPIEAGHDLQFTPSLRTAASGPF